MDSIKVSDFSTTWANQITGTTTYVPAWRALHPDRSCQLHLSLCLIAIVHPKCSVQLTFTHVGGKVVQSKNRLEGRALHPGICHAKWSFTLPGYSVKHWMALVYSSLYCCGWKSTATVKWYVHTLYFCRAFPPTTVKWPVH